MLYDVTLTLQEELLGTASANPELYEEFIESKRPDNGNGDSETDTLPPVSEQVQKGTTVFHRDGDKPMIYDYQIKGFLKDACGALRRADDTESSAIKAYRKEIDGLAFVTPRKIVAELPAEGKVGICVRPLRAQTAQGERVSLARSETLPAGTVFRFRVHLLSAKLEDALYEWLEYGQLRGLGQWRNSGKGRFAAEIVKVKQEKKDE